MKSLYFDSDRVWHQFEQKQLVNHLTCCVPEQL